MAATSNGTAPHHQSPVDEMEALLRPLARGALPNRAQQLDYARCRQELLDSPAKELLPGFLYQCLTIFKFKDFITLYDPDAGLREAFVSRTFDRCRAMIADRGRSDRPAAPAADDRTDPQHWMR